MTRCHMPGCAEPAMTLPGIDLPTLWCAAHRAVVVAQAKAATKAATMTYRNRILVGDVCEQLATLPDESVHCVVTSPPYWGLRSYGTSSQVWGGDDACEHVWGAGVTKTGGAVYSEGAKAKWQHEGGERPKGHEPVGAGAFCECGAWRGDLGLEPTPELFVQNMVAVFREVRRVLRSDGTLWLNLGDCYAHPTSGGGGAVDVRTDGRNTTPGDQVRGRMAGANTMTAGLKPKDLVGMPWRVAFALQADGWWLRSDIIWSKPNPMPESVTDRPTKSHEYLFLLTKSERYFYDIEAIREPLNPTSIARISQANFAKQTGGPKDYALTGEGIHSQRKTLENFAASHRVAGDRALGAKLIDAPDDVRASASARMGRGAGWRDDPTVATATGRNRRTVWEIATQPYAEAHFATYPEALVLPCIQAGTSEHGVCSVCGAPWRRVVETTLAPTQRVNNGKRYDDGESFGWKTSGTNETRTTGWEPTCKHEAPLARAVVLDPFFGSGTTGLVAKRAGRDYVGIELNETYAALAERRIGSQGALL